MSKKPAAKKRKQANSTKATKFVLKITQVQGSGGIAIIPFNPPKR
jgi:hypothetical protein